MFRSYAFAVVFLIVPSATFAQSAASISAFAERGGNRDVPSGYGGELSYGRSWGELRLSGRLGSDDLQNDYWAFDTDVSMAPMQFHSALSSLLPFGLDPYVFAGVGAVVREVETDDELRLGPSVSWGGGVRVPLIGQTAYGFTETRNRKGDWEVRAGARITLRWGGDASPRARGGAVPVPAPSGGAPKPYTPPAEGLAGYVLEAAASHLGVPYRWGGEDPANGFDCSGFTQYVYAELGVVLPRVSRDQANSGRSVKLARSAFQPGDLLFFAGDHKTIDHVAIYVGDGRIIHAPSTGSVVRYDDLDAPSGKWFKDRLVAARRVL